MAHQRWPQQKGHYHKQQSRLNNKVAIQVKQNEP